MKIECDPAKRVETLAKRGLDMAHAGLVFDNEILTVVDDRKDYGEQRFVTAGRLRGRMVYMGVDSPTRRAAHHQHEESQ